MEFGLSLPGRGPLARPDVVLKIAEKADALRYTSLFVTDHVVLPVVVGASRCIPTRRAASSRAGRAGLPRAAGDARHLAHATRAPGSAPACWSFPIAIPS